MHFKCFIGNFLAGEVPAYGILRIDRARTNQETNKDKHFPHNTNISMQKSCFKFYFSVKSCLLFLLVVSGWLLVIWVMGEDLRTRKLSIPHSQIARTSRGFLRFL